MTLLKNCMRILINISLKKKVQQFEKELGEVKEKISNVEISKTHLEKENKILREKKNGLPPLFQYFLVDKNPLKLF